MDIFLQKVLLNQITLKLDVRHRKVLQCLWPVMGNFKRVQSIEISTCGLYRVMGKLLLTFPSSSHSSSAVCGKKVYMNSLDAPRRSKKAISPIFIQRSCNQTSTEAANREHEQIRVEWGCPRFCRHMVHINHPWFCRHIKRISESPCRGSVYSANFVGLPSHFRWV